MIIKREPPLLQNFECQVQFDQLILKPSTNADNNAIQLTFPECTSYADMIQYKELSQMQMALRI